MDNKHKVKIYPVDNGDTSLIKLADGTTIITDCNIRKASTDDKEADVYDVKSDLLDELQRRNDSPYTDVFILTHPDNDHCRGFKTHFYTGKPEDYGNSNKENDEIIIDELWVTSMLFTTSQCDDANGIRTEANRRIKLYNDGSSERYDWGNRLRLTGYDSDGRFENVPRHIPGDYVSSFSGVKQENFELFIHAPFKDGLIEGKANKDRNATSIVYQARFKGKNKDTFWGRFMFPGDADHYIWEKILSITKDKNREHALIYDVFMAPHHCSWTYFNDVPYSENTEPKAHAHEILDYGLDGAKVIASSKKILDDDKNPPHYPAKTEYLSKLEGDDNFINTAANGGNNAPQPILFYITEDGVSQKDSAIDTEARKMSQAQTGGVLLVSSTSKPAGIKLRAKSNGGVYGQE